MRPNVLCNGSVALAVSVLTKFGENPPATVCYARKYCENPYLVKLEVK